MFDRLMARPIGEVGWLEPWQPIAIVLSQFLAELAFSVAESFGIFVSTAFVFGWHQGIRTAPFQMTRSYDRSRPTSMMSGASLMHFPELMPR
jgi:hypothetical protein